MEKLARITDASVRQKTGRGWNGWVETLDKAGAAPLAHYDIARLVHERFGIGGWWSQTVTVGYEQAKGRRVEGRNCGGFAPSVSKTAVQVQHESLAGPEAVEPSKARWREIIALVTGAR